MSRLRRWLAGLGEPHPAWKMLGREDARHLLYPEDIFLVSYPRSGNTWVRAIVAYLLFPPERIQALKDLNELVPGIHRGLPPLQDSLKPRVIKSHRGFPYRHNRDDAALYRRVAYLVRHPFDVVRSLHHYELQTRPGLTMEQTLEEFVLGKSEWGSWQDHVLGWKAQERSREMLFLRYEDFRADFAGTTAKLARFLGREPTPELIGRAREGTSRDAMVQLEQKGWIKPPSAEFIRRSDAPRATEQELTAAQKAWIRECFGYAMGLFGYGGETKP